MSNGNINNGEPSYRNLNTCRTFVTDALVFPDQICGEVIVINRLASPITINDAGHVGAEFGFILNPDESFTFRGVTNSNSLTASVSGLTIRTQFYSNSPSR